MFHLNGIQRNLHNLLLFCRQQTPWEKPPTGGALKAAYNRLLAEMQPTFTTSDRPEPEWVTDVDEAARLAGLYKSEGGLIPLNDEVIAAARIRQDPGIVGRRVALTAEAMDLLRRGCPALGGLFDLAINRLF